MWNPFKKKLIDPTRNIVDELANRISQEGKIEQLEVALAGLKSTELNETELESWHHLHGICAFQRSEHELALERFQEGLRECPESSQLKFSTAQEYIFLSQPNEAFPLFDECPFPSVSSAFTLAMSRYAYLFSEHGRGIKYLENLIEAYKNIKVLDDHFLYVRGLPFFSTTWANLAAHCVLSDQQEFLQATTEEIGSICHDYDFEVLGMDLQAVVSNDYSAMVEPLQARIDASKNYTGHDGYMALQLSVFHSFSSETYPIAMETLEKRKLSDNDFPWLEDMRTLAKAAVSNRFREDSETGLIDSFLENQPLLFEPEHVVNFGLLTYQETIKPRAAVLSKIM